MAASLQGRVGTCPAGLQVIRGVCAGFHWEIKRERRRLGERAEDHTQSRARLEEQLSL